MQAAIVDNIISNAEIIFKDLEIKQGQKIFICCYHLNWLTKLLLVTQNLSSCENLVHQRGFN